MKDRMIPVGIRFSKAMLATLRMQAAAEKITLGEFVRRTLHFGVTWNPDWTDNQVQVDATPSDLLIESGGR